MGEVPLAIRAKAEIELRRRRAARLGVERLQGVVITPLWEDPPPPPDDLEDAVAFTGATAAAERRQAARAAIAAMLATRRAQGV